jgi:hypothetical protein
MAQDSFWRAFLAQPSDELSEAVDRLHSQLVDQGIDELVASAYLTYAPLYHERRAVYRFTQRSLEWQGFLPEITSPDEACRLAVGEFRLSAPAVRELARLLSLSPSELFAAAPAPPPSAKNAMADRSRKLRAQALVKLFRMPPDKRERLLHLERARRGLPQPRPAPLAATTSPTTAPESPDGLSGIEASPPYPISAERIHYQGPPEVGSYLPPLTYETAAPAGKHRPQDPAAGHGLDRPADEGALSGSLVPTEPNTSPYSDAQIKSIIANRLAQQQVSPPSRKPAWLAWSIGALVPVAAIAWLILTGPSEAEKLRNEIELHEADIRLMKAELLRTSLECAADRVEFPDTPSVAETCERVRADTVRSYASSIESQKRHIDVLKDRMERVQDSR